tara:strand:+ start:469 stop:591 length:123 start_codon:yes stop_codon:yes gene_type:complete
MPNKKSKERKRKRYRLNKELNKLGRTAKQIEAIKRKTKDV